MIIVVIPNMKLTNPLNSSQGFSKGATMAKARARKTARADTYTRINAQQRCRHAPWELVRVGLAITLTRISPRRFDSDGLAAAFKGQRDGIADWLGIDDGNPLLEWRYAQRKGRPREYAVHIAIEPRA